MGVTASELIASPRWLPLEAAADGRIRLLGLTEAAYRAASFLDRRLLGMKLPEAHCEPDVLEEAAARLAARPQFIFHLGHVGSTLIARLLGEHPQLFVLREPALLRAQALGVPATPPLPVLVALYGRSWRAGQQALIKATSFVSARAAELLAAPEGLPAVFVLAQPDAYLGGILAGPNSRAESQKLMPMRLARLARLLEADAEALRPASEGETIALGWLTEMCALEAAVARSALPPLWVDFDAFLRAPAATLTRMLVALRKDPSALALEALVHGPIMQRYSKAPEHPYDSGLRQALLAQAALEEGAQLRSGLAWLARMAGQHPLAAAALTRARAAASAA